VTEVRVEDTTVARIAYPSDWHRTGAILDLLSDLVLVHVQAHQQTQHLGSFVAAGIVLINFVTVPETFAVKRRVQYMIGIVQLECPRAARAPRVATKSATNDRPTWWEIAKVIAGRVNTSEPLAISDKIQPFVLLSRFLKLHPCCVVQENRIVLLQVLFRK